MTQVKSGATMTPMSENLNEPRSKRLAERMDELDMKVMPLAKASGIARNTIYNALAGKANARETTYATLFRVLDDIEADRQSGVERYEPEGVPDLVTIQMTGVFGIESVTFSGPTEDAEAIKQAAADFVRQMRESSKDG